MTETGFDATAMLEAYRERVSLERREVIRTARGRMRAEVKHLKKRAAAIPPCEVCGWAAGPTSLYRLADDGGDIRVCPNDRAVLRRLFGTQPAARPMTREAVREAIGLLTGTFAYSSQASVVGP